MPGDAFQLGRAFLFQLGQVGFALVQLALALIQLAIALFDLFQLGVQSLLAALEAFFGPLHLAPAALNLRFGFLQDLNSAFLGSQLNGLGLGLGIGNEPLGLDLGVANQCFGFAAYLGQSRLRHEVADQASGYAGCQEDQQAEEQPWSCASCQHDKPSLSERFV